MAARRKKEDDYLKEIEKKISGIREDLLNQFTKKGIEERYYTDLVDDYMDLWATKTMLQNDIRRRGVTVEYNNGGGQSGFKKNESVDQLLKVNQQMLKILDYLDIKPSKVEGEVDEDM